jgi:predicted NodU family carbamoyl transferase
MATIASTDWNSCAILLSDSYHTRLGYYIDNSFHWIRSFEYPNNIALFSASVSRFLGYNLLEDKMRWLSHSGDSKYSTWIAKNVCKISDGNYQLLHNLERGFGVGVPDANIAASAQVVISAVLVNLAQWLRGTIDIPRLAIVGRGAANYIANSAIAELSGYENIAAISVTGAASTALGAAALLQRPILEHAYIGPSKVQTITPDELANKLIQGEVVAHYAEAEFSDNSFINANNLTLAYKPRIQNLSSQPYYVLCQDTDYHKYFEGKFIPYFGQYSSSVKNKQVIDTDTARVLCVSKNKNPYINRVLEITRAAGYPVIVSTQINEI